MENLILIIKSASLIAIFYSIYRFFLAKETLFSFNRHFLLGGMIASTLLPFLIITKQIVIAVEPIKDSTSTMPISQNIAFNSAQVEIINWWQVLLVIYLVGAVIMGFRLVFQLLSLQKLFKKYEGENTKGFVHIKVNSQIMPFSFFNYIVYNPKLHTAEELTFIINHEHVHASQLHSIDILLVNIFLAFQWFNPLAYLYKKAIEENLEFMADQKTTSNLPNKIDYQLALVKTSSTFTTPALVTNFKQSFIKKRIIMLNKKSSNRKNLFKTFLILPILALFLYSFNVKEKVKYIQKESALPSTESKISGQSTISTKNKTEKIDIMENENNLNNESPEISKEEKSNTKIQDVKIIITKSTTKEELEAIKKNLKENYEVDFNYSNLNYNSSNELMGISISYSDSRGNKGNYNISTSKPINDIYISRTEKGAISFSNATKNEEEFEMDFDENGKIHTEKARLTSEAARKNVDARRLEMDKMRNKMEERRAEMEIKREEMQARSEKMQEENKLRNEKIAEKNTDRKGQMMEEFTKMREEMENKMDPSKLKTITKDMTDADLENLKRDFENDNITFNYSGVRRNSVGEITSIKLKLDNNQGSKSNSNVNSDSAISPITLGMDKNSSIIRN